MQEIPWNIKVIGDHIASRKRLEHLKTRKLTPEEKEKQKAILEKFYKIGEEIKLNSKKRSE